MKLSSLPPYLLYAYGYSSLDWLQRIQSAAQSPLSEASNYSIVDESEQPNAESMAAASSGVAAKSTFQSFTPIASAIGGTKGGFLGSVLGSLFGTWMGSGIDFSSLRNIFNRAPATAVTANPTTQPIATMPVEQPVAAPVIMNNQRPLADQVNPVGNMGPRTYKKVVKLLATLNENDLRLFDQIHQQPLYTPPSTLLAQNSATPGNGALAPQTVLTPTLLSAHNEAYGRESNKLRQKKQLPKRYSEQLLETENGDTRTIRIQETKIKRKELAQSSADDIHKFIYYPPVKQKQYLYY